MIDVATSARITAKLKELLARAEAGDFSAVAVVTVTASSQVEVWADTANTPILTPAIVGGMTMLSTILTTNTFASQKPNA